MIRFEAGMEEITALFAFLRRRAPRGKLLMVPLSFPSDNAPTVRSRPFRTPRPLLEALVNDKEAHCFGIAFPSSDVPSSLSADDCLMQLFLSPADTQSRRGVLLEVRDALGGDPPRLTNDACTARDLGERMARRLRRRGTRDGIVWRLPD